MFASFLCISLELMCWLLTFPSVYLCVYWWTKFGALNSVQPFACSFQLHSVVWTPLSFCVCLCSSELSVHFTPILLCQAGEGVSCLAVLPILAFGLFGHCRPQSLASGGTFWVGYTLRFLDSDYVHRSRRHIVWYCSCLRLWDHSVQYCVQTNKHIYIYIYIY